MPVNAHDSRSPLIAISAGCFHFHPSRRAPRPAKLFKPPFELSAHLARRLAVIRIARAVLFTMLFQELLEEDHEDLVFARVLDQVAHRAAAHVVARLTSTAVPARHFVV